MANCKKCKAEIIWLKCQKKDGEISDKPHPIDAVSEFTKLIEDPSIEEPVGWVRSIPDMRRRPGGDKEKEYVAT